MANWAKRYWKELLVFGAIFGVLLLCCIPNFTWLCTDCDGIHYTYSAKYLYPAHKTSAPLFLLLGNLILRIPFGAEPWRFAMLSVLTSTASAVFVYLIIKTKLASVLVRPEEIRTQDNKNRTYALIGALVFGGSALVISQSIIIETYALVTMFGLGACYFAFKEKWLPCALMLGAGLATHVLICVPILILMVFHKGLRKWRYAGATAIFLLFYAYIPITTAVNNPPEMWGNTTGESFLVDNISTAMMLGGGLSIWDLPKRILDGLGVVGLSLGLGSIVLITFMGRRFKRLTKEPLFWLFILPVAGFMTNLAPQTYVYMMPSIGIGAVIVGTELARMKPYWKWAVAGTAVALLVFNANYFDMGRTLDPELSASKYYYEELDKVPDGEILVAQQGWEWAAIYFYNKENDRNIIPVCVGTLPSIQYQDSLRAQGILLEEFKDEPLGSRPTLIARSIVELNENTWTTKSTNPETYGAEIVPAKGNEYLITLSPVSITDGSMDMIWRWRPSNPYDIITGAIEVEQWIWIVFSNYTVLTFTMLGTIGAVPCWIGYMLIVKKKRWNLRKKQRITVDA